MSAGAGAGWLLRAAPAKINLYLHVLGRRPDGFHLLDSLIAFADLHDTVAARRAEALTLTVEGAGGADIGDSEANLVIRAARALAEAAGVPARAEIRLSKQLPVAGGVGGGSADAAAALSLLSELWGLGDDVPLERIALGLGADVPMCLGGRAAFAGGIGEDLNPAPDLPEAWLLLVNPGRPVATPRVFAAREGPFSEPDRFTAPPATARDLAALLAARRNDLEAPARRIEPAIGRVLDALRQAPGTLLARMSGSGASCFGLYGSLGEASDAGEALALQWPDWWIGVSRLVGDTREVRATLT